MRSPALLASLLLACSTAVDGTGNVEGGSSSSSGGSTSGQPSSASTSTSSPDEELPSQAAPPTDLKVVGLCVLALAGRDPGQALRFYATSAIANGAVTVDLAPLVGWSADKKSALEPFEVEVANTTGGHLTATAPLVGDKFALDLGAITIPAAANSVSGRSMTVERTELRGAFSANRTKFCARLSGQQTAPYAYAFDPAQNTCIFLRTRGSGTVPASSPADFVCDP